MIMVAVARKEKTKQWERERHCTEPHRLHSYWAKGKEIKLKSIWKLKLENFPGMLNDLRCCIRIFCVWDGLFFRLSLCCRILFFSPDFDTIKIKSKWKWISIDIFSPSHTACFAVDLFVSPSFESLTCVFLCELMLLVLVLVLHST